MNRLFIVLTISLLASVADAAPTWNRVANAPGLNEIGVGTPTPTGPELWGLSSSACDSCDRAIWHRPGGVQTAWVQTGGAANHLASSPTTAVVLTQAENQVYVWDQVRTWVAISMTGGPTCMRRISTYGPFIWVRDCQASPKIWVRNNSSWSLFGNQFPGPGIAVDVMAAPIVSSVPWIVNFNSGNGQFNVYYSFTNPSPGWAIAGGSLIPPCIESAGIGPGASGTETWATDAGPGCTSTTGNGYWVRHHANATATWEFIDSPGMVRIKPDQTYGIPFATDNLGQVWCYCQVGSAGCG